MKSKQFPRWYFTMVVGEQSKLGWREREACSQCLSCAAETCTRQRGIAHSPGLCTLRVTEVRYHPPGFMCSSVPRSLAFQRGRLSAIASHSAPAAHLGWLKAGSGLEDMLLNYLKGTTLNMHWDCGSNRMHRECTGFPPWENQGVA